MLQANTHAARTRSKMIRRRRGAGELNIIFNDCMREFRREIWMIDYLTLQQQQQQFLFALFMYKREIILSW